MATSYYKLEIENRKSVGKKATKEIRRAGKIPSVLYYKGEKPVSISIDKQLLNQAIKSDQRIYEVEIDSGSQYVMIKEATHGVLSGPAIERLKNSPITNFIVTDTILIPNEKKLDNMKIVTVADVFGAAIKRIHNGESVSSLFEF